ncbi:hypothetical protein BJV74DRAFT_795122 [Russula compacta]|nr:hypothetical protein BJV74DRAFT_795122 [Russula compacta]
MCDAVGVLAIPHPPTSAATLCRTRRRAIFPRAQEKDHGLSTFSARLGVSWRTGIISRWRTPRWTSTHVQYRQARRLRCAPTDLVVTALGHHTDPLLAAYYDPALGRLRTDGGRVLCGTNRALRRVYASGWAATCARGVLAATMIDAYAVADAILTDHFGDGSGASAGGAVPVPVQGGVYSRDVLVADDVDLESVPREIEQGVKDRRVVEYDQWKKIDAEEIRRGEERGKERERMGWEEAHEFLTSGPPTRRSIKGLSLCSMVVYALRSAEYTDVSAHHYHPWSRMSSSPHSVSMAISAQGCQGLVLVTSELGMIKLLQDLYSVWCQEQKVKGPALFWSWKASTTRVVPTRIGRKGSGEMDRGGNHG